MKKIISRYIKKLQDWFSYNAKEERLYSIADQQFRILNTRISTVQTIRDLVNIRSQIKNFKPWLVQNELYAIYEQQYIELYNRWNSRLLMWKKRGY